ncbi:aminotransferase class V-fold PLP-dependent enzyme [Macrococcoides canis]|uniref:aminotransferase class V-fold PLP-dependent enzyme n=1 Tax=Macrococcoides canis TaxID=1855823 RepID=UPI0020B74DD9|nr:aminotransferase class V-fold PLP-dependent enzyme [Macrococcus canis]UTH02387.1 aminotransferase class V-fold PLP-dependent enzyme [Macrococcus canis]
MNLNNPILNQMKGHFEGMEPISLHVPGHHYNTIGHLNKLKFKYDVTEIEGMDDYHHPESIILESEKNLSRNDLYNSKYLVGGTTSGILSAILGVLNTHQYEGEHCIAIMRNAHKSIINAINIAKSNAYILPTNISEATNEYSGIDLSKINHDILKNIAVVVLTYPNYFGETYPINEVIDFFRARNIITIIDEAHGAHFDISPIFPSSSINYGADIIVQSYHKTLPAFTMSSVMHIRKDNPYIEDIWRMCSMLQSSSPSYMLMLGLEHAHQFYLAYDDCLFSYRRQELIKTFRDRGFQVIMPSDPLKLMIAHQELSGFQVAELLSQHHIYTELCNEKFALIVLPLWHNEDSYPFNMLLERIKQLKIKVSALKHIVVNDTNILINKNSSDGVMNYRMQSSSKNWVPLSESEGHFSVQPIVPYPPGIPLIMQGEEIKKAVIDELAKYISNGGKVHGIREGSILVYQ